MIKETIIFLALTGQTISKETGISIALVLGLMGATVWTTNAFNTTQNEIENIKRDVEQIKNSQNELNSYVRNQSFIIHDWEDLSPGQQ